MVNNMEYMVLELLHEGESAHYTEGIPLCHHLGKPLV